MLLFAEGMLEEQEMTAMAEEQELQQQEAAGEANGKADKDGESLITTKNGEWWNQLVLSLWFGHWIITTMIM